MTAPACRLPSNVKLHLLCVQRVCSKLFVSVWERWRRRYRNSATDTCTEGELCFLTELSSGVMAILQARKESFQDSMLRFAQENDLGSILLLTGADVTNRSDSQMLYVALTNPSLLKAKGPSCDSSPSYALLPPKSPSLENSKIQLIEKLPLYRYEPSVGHLEGAESQLPKPATPIIPGGGLTRRLLSVFSMGLVKPIPIAAIVQFVVEGDNRGDAEFFARTVAQVLGLHISEWIQPPSWRIGLFGTPHDQSLYG